MTAVMFQQQTDHVMFSENMVALKCQLTMGAVMCVVQQILRAFVRLKMTTVIVSETLVSC